MNMSLAPDHCTWQDMEMKKKRLQTTDECSPPLVHLPLPPPPPPSTSCIPHPAPVPHQRCSSTHAGAIKPHRSRVSTYLPTKFSRTEDLPALCPPTTAICGSSRMQLRPRTLNASWSRFTSAMSSCMPWFPMITQKTGSSRDKPCRE